MASTHEHLEHSHHAQHAAHDPFDRRVAVSMAIIAACLAGVATLGHRKHNDVLRIVGEANRLRTEAAAADVEKSNLFAWFQSKKNRTLQYEAAVVQVAQFPADNKDPHARQVIDSWKKKLLEVTDPGERKKQDDELAEINKKGKAKEAEAVRLLGEADELRDDAVHNHHQADRLDIAHLSAEIGLVVCSLALLTKRRGYWYFGMTATVVSLALAASAYMMENHAAGGHAAPGAGGHAAPAAGGHPPADHPAVPAAADHPTKAPEHGPNAHAPEHGK
ncbi:DUF4337 family protein [Limnoglobus roseus]|uniref:DUF4337 domain-containing protein n=1 Tax=Limnoglobus roseus TaxID=2598579 RepID=A0A5C1AJQ1_9BACT|nr:DUF4337 family protein [Limnoglobus roseus]QEL19431.1 hypothetical protein PX52LOC_06503 [Limnoglobus roseus]